MTLQEQSSENIVGKGDNAFQLSLRKKSNLNKI